MRRFSFVAAALLALAATAADAGELRKARRRIANRYIVVLKPAPVGTMQARSVQALAETHAQAYGARAQFVYRNVLRGYAAEMTEVQAAQLALDPEVAYVEEDGVVTTMATQTGATWGLDRIDQRNMPLSGTYNYNVDGSGVHAYVIDTGVRASHQELASRMGNGFTAINDSNGTNDCNGHGTHVAGTIGGTTWGVAKKVTIHPVRVLGCTGQGAFSGVIAGVDWVRTNHIKPAVANMSLGGGASAAVDTAVQNAIAAGVTFAVAAGNSNVDACGSSPARAPNAITVASSTRSDQRSSFSNTGACVDVFAPGSDITSAWITNDTATRAISGTSMASPHVAGVAALYLSQNPTASPAAVAAAIVNNATPGKIVDAGTNSPNLLLYSLFDGPIPTPTPTPVTTPTPRPTATPTLAPTRTPTPGPTRTPTPRPTAGPTRTPTPVPTVGPTRTPTPRPTVPTPGVPVEITPDATRVTASSSLVGMRPANTVDNNLLTRWSAVGDNEWLMFDLGTFRRVSFVKIAVFQGAYRNQKFDLQVSFTGAPGTWRTVFSGQSGLSRDEQTFDFPDTYARYLRYVGHGSTVPIQQPLNSLTEVSIFAAR